MSDKQAQLNVKVPDELKRQARIIALQTGRTLQDVIQELVEKWVRDHKQPGK